MTAVGCEVQRSVAIWGGYVDTGTPFDKNAGHGVVAGSTSQVQCSAAIITALVDQVAQREALPELTHVPTLDCLVEGEVSSKHWCGMGVCVLGRHVV